MPSVSVNSGRIQLIHALYRTLFMICVQIGGFGSPLCVTPLQLCLSLLSRRSRRQQLASVAAKHTQHSHLMRIHWHHEHFCPSLVARCHPAVSSHLILISMLLASHHSKPRGRDTQWTAPSERQPTGTAHGCASLAAIRETFTKSGGGWA
jgi:hypothetical protein